jgi:hypothetical protein
MLGESMTSQQSTNAVVMIRPHRFFCNPETAADNAFQRETIAGDAEKISHRALKEFDDAVNSLCGAGITVHVFDDTPAPEKPDAIFPNNWFSTHADGRIVLYPMYSPARRRERRSDIIDALRKKYRVAEVVDYSDYEERDLFLEGTGSLVLDHENRIAYVSLSKRSDPQLIEKFCADFGYDPVVFESVGDDGRPIYHTNVMLCLGSNFALIGLEMIPDSSARQKVRDRLQATGKSMIQLNRRQIANFAGNALEVDGGEGKLLVLSERAAASLSTKQRATLESEAKLLPLSLATIELAGGSARCMMAEIFLPPL